MSRLRFDKLEEYSFEFDPLDALDIEPSKLGLVTQRLATDTGNREHILLSSFFVSDSRCSGSEASRSDTNAQRLSVSTISCYWNQT